MTFLRTAKVFLMALCVGGAVVALVGQDLSAAAQPAEEQAAELERILLIPDLLAVMQKEGIAYGEQVATKFFDGTPDGDWSADVARIYDPARIGPVFRVAFD